MPKSTILGYREDELTGQDWFATCLPRSIDVEQVREVFKQALAGNLADSKYYENPVRTRSGGERLIAWHNSCAFLAQMARNSAPIHSSSAQRSQ